MRFLHHSNSQVFDYLKQADPTDKQIVIYNFLIFDNNFFLDMQIVAKWPLKLRDVHGASFAGKTRKSQFTKFPSPFIYDFSLSTASVHSRFLKLR